MSSLLPNVPMPPTGGAAHLTGLMWMAVQSFTLAPLFAIHPQPVPLLPVVGQESAHPTSNLDQLDNTSSID